MRQDPIDPAVVKITSIIRNAIAERWGELLPECILYYPEIHFNSAGQFRTEFAIRGKQGLYRIQVDKMVGKDGRPEPVPVDEEVPEGTIYVDASEMDP